MGRPREHDERTRASLVAAAERLVSAGGPEALSVRAVADEAGTSTRAVYSLFGSKEGLVNELAGMAFDELGARVAAAPQTDDPAADLVELGATVYRRFIAEHPWLYRIAFQRVLPQLDFTPELAERRRRNFGVLEARVRRLEEAGRLRGSVRAAAVKFNAMCEGLANARLRGGTMLAGEVEDEAVWRDAFETVVRGLAD